MPSSRKVELHEMLLVPNKEGLSVSSEN